jgi:hypothetical protein
MAFCAPAHHSASEVGDFIEAGFLQHDRRLRRTPARAANGDNGTLFVQLPGAVFKLA